MAKIIPTNGSTLIKNVGSKSLPDNPSKSGFSAVEIKNALNRPIELLYSWTSALDEKLENYVDGSTVVEKAKKDKDGNQIDTTYAKLAGNNSFSGTSSFSGALTFTADLNFNGTSSKLKGQKDFYDQSYFHGNSTFLSATIIQAYLTTYNVLPATDNTYDLGSSSKVYKKIYANGISDGTYSLALPAANGTVITAELVASIYETKTDAAAKVDRSNLVTIIKEATQSMNGLMSATDKARLDALYAMLDESEENSVVDSINEILSIFEDYPEGADLVTVLAGKIGFSDVINNVISDEINKPLAAYQGKVLKGLIDTINATIADYLVSVASIAPVYSSSETYSKGDMVVHEITLYRALQDISTAEAWNSSHWESVNVVDLIGEKITLGAGERDATLKVGHADSAKSLDTEVGNTDETPFSAMTVGGSADVETGEQVLKKLVGVDLVRNQLVKVSTIASSGSNSDIGWVKNEDGSITVNGTTTAAANFRIATSQVQLTAGHMYMSSVSDKGNLYLQLDSSPYTSFRKPTIVQTSGTYDIGIRIAAYGSYSSEKIFPMLVDVTRLFGSNEVVEAVMGSGTASEQAAKVLAFDPNIFKDHSYNEGSFPVVKAKYLETIDYNQWKGTATDGVAMSSNGGTYPSSAKFATAYVRVVNKAYYLDPAKWEQWVNWYDSDKNFISQTSAESNLITPPPNAFYGRFTGFLSSKETAYLCIYWDGSRIGYEKYQRHFIELPNKQGHGILKVVDGKVVADGDEWYPDGTGKQNYVMADMSSFAWEHQGEGTWKSTSIASSVKIPSNNSEKPDISCNKYDIVSADSMSSSTLAISQTGNLFVNNGSTVNSPTGIIVYKLSTPVDLTDQGAFPESFYGDDFGTMRFLDEDGNEIAGLLGAEVFYKANVAGFAESLYVKTGGDPDALVLDSELSAVNAKFDPVKASLFGVAKQILAKNNSLDFLDLEAVDMGGLSWSYNSGYHGFIATVSGLDNSNTSSQKANVLCPLYKTMGAFEADPTKGQIYAWTGLGSNMVIVYATVEGNDPDKFKAMVNGVPLAYKKASS